jgi:hypothetical protein
MDKGEGRIAVSCGCRGPTGCSPCCSPSITSLPWRRFTGGVDGTTGKMLGGGLDQRTAPLAPSPQAPRLLERWLKGGACVLDA